MQDIAGQVELVQEDGGNNTPMKEEDATNADDPWQDAHDDPSFYGLFELLPDVKQRHQLGKGAIHEDDACGIGGDGRSPTQRDGDLRLFHGNRIVDAIPHKADRFPTLLDNCSLSLQLFDEIGLIFG